MLRTMDDPSELWRIRKQFALQLAACSFMTYVFCLSSRHPTRFHISRSTGQIAMTELLPGMSESHQLSIQTVLNKACQPGVSNQAPVFATSDVVPFRFTPNMQTFIKPIFTDGVLASGIMAIARSLTEPEVCAISYFASLR
jgi:transformation/transcription domain-associated protein